MGILFSVSTFNYKQVGIEKKSCFLSDRVLKIGNRKTSCYFLYGKSYFDSHNLTFILYSLMLLGVEH